MEFDGKTETYMNVEEIVLGNLEMLFPGTKILDKLIFRVTRNSDYGADEDGALDLKEHLEEGLREQKFSPVNATWIYAFSLTNLMNLWKQSR